VDRNHGSRTETNVLPVSRCAQNSLQDENMFCANVTSLIGWWIGGNSGRPTVFPDRHCQDASAVCAGIRQGWRFSRDLQRCGQCGCWQRPRRYAWNRLSGNGCSDAEITAAAFFSTYEAMKHSIPLHDQLAPVKHMLSASVAEVASSSLAKFIFRK
jgi:hypothetical protein